MPPVNKHYIIPIWRMQAFVLQISGKSVAAQIGTTPRGDSGLYRFMGYLMRLPDDLAVQYKKEIESIEGELNMPYITDTERLARRQGQAEGQLQGLREAVTEALQARFGDIPYALREAVSRITDDKELKRLHRLAITARSLADFTV